MTTTKKTAKKTTATKATKPTNKKVITPKATVAKPKTGERKPSRKDAIIALISRPNGATLPEIMKATEWQKHSVRGMISILGRTLKIESSKNDAGERTYSAGNAPKAAAKPAKAAKAKAAAKKGKAAAAPTAPVDQPAA